MKVHEVGLSWNVSSPVGSHVSAIARAVFDGTEQLAALQAILAE
jgi:hypothetical protein